MSSIENQLKENIKKYISLDNYIKEQNTKLATYREQKRSLEENILYTIKEYDLKDIEINLPDGKLEYLEKETHSSISIQFLRNSIINYYSEKTKNMILANQQAETLLNYILNQRSTKIEPTLKRSRKRN
jgi:hypothetical protein